MSRGRGTALFGGVCACHQRPLHIPNPALSLSLLRGVPWGAGVIDGAPPTLVQSLPVLPFVVCPGVQA